MSSMPIGGPPGKRDIRAALGRGSPAGAAAAATAAAAAAAGAASYWLFFPVSLDARQEQTEQRNAVL